MSDDEVDENDLKEKLRQRLLSMKPEKVDELKNKLGLELFKKTFAIVNENEASTSIKQDKLKQKSNKRPREISSKFPVSKFRKLENVEKTKKYDPRFFGNDFDEVQFRKNYSFLDDLRKEEIKELKKAYATALKESPKHVANRIKKNILRLENQLKSSIDSRLKLEINAELREENIKRMNSGERPIYYNNQQFKNRLLEKKANTNIKK